MNTPRLFQHKNYTGTVEVNTDEGGFYGKVGFVRDLISYEAETIPELKVAFIEAVDEYLADCQELERQ
ncbi:hypothetical protein [Aestuariirhabdus sp. LZHN29]|uniref:hypothetical protein n=1 Tax=Aestuariirhabdus sp. LZHN29 TaxID=3417462 RepID=UPI003CF5F22A